MKDLSFVFLKNLMGAKMGKGFRNFCNNDNSTSTLNQHNNNLYDQQSSSCVENGCNSPNFPPRKSVTLEEMILQLDLEEEKARKQKAASYNKFKEEDEVEEEEDIKSRFHHRMSCVNNSDVVRSARNALNQYPRFSLDGGRDAMYRSSFQINGLKLGRILHLPKSVGGESVIWCKPGLVPKLMGLEAMPVPLRTFHYNNKSRDKEDICTAIKNQNIRRRAQRLKQHTMESSVCHKNIKRSGKGGSVGSSSCTLNGYRVMNPIAVEPVLGLGGTMSWSTPYDYS